jgi:hypothetical protein
VSPGLLKDGPACGFAISPASLIRLPPSARLPSKYLTISTTLISGLPASTLKGDVVVDWFGDRADFCFDAPFENVVNWLRD